MWLTARRLHQALAGRVLTRSDFRVPRYATTDLTGQLVTEAVSRGKHLLVRTGKDVTVHTHLRMDGSWRVRPARDRVASSHRIRLILANTDWQAVGYQLGVVEVLATANEHTVVGYLGPDLLGPDWDPDEAVRRLAAHPDETIGEALLDQRNLAGVGNLYKCEVLFLRGVSPWTPVGAVPDLAGTVALVQRLLAANRGRWTQSTTGSLHRGQTSYVYGRRAQPCRRCGTAIRKEELGERVTYWCPTCQPDHR